VHRPRQFARDRGAGTDGVAAEYLVLSAEELFKVPGFLTDAESSTLPCAAVTAWSSVTRNVSLNPGDMVLIQGTGGVSLFALAVRLGGWRRDLPHLLQQRKTGACAPH